MEDILVKSCCTCKEMKSIEEFNKNKSSIDGLSRRCRDCEKVGHKKWRENNKEQLQQAGRDYYYKNKEECNRRSRKTARNVRMDVLLYYSNRKLICNCCSESEIMFLCIDHINGNGNEHRREIQMPGCGGVRFYRWLKKNGYPEGFQVLCHNCNCAKGFYGECPHETRRRLEIEGLKGKVCLI